MNRTISRIAIATGAALTPALAGCSSGDDPGAAGGKTVLTVSLWKTNYTHDLVRESGTLAITLLHESQLSLVDALGLTSGRDTDKLSGLQYNVTEAGDPWFPGGVALLSCDVLEALDLGDATSFLCAVRQQERLREGAPITWPDARERMSDDFNERYNEKSGGDIDWARPRMVWRG